MRFRDIDADVKAVIVGQEEADYWNGYRYLVQVADVQGADAGLARLFDLYVKPPPGPGSTVVIWTASDLVYDGYGAWPAAPEFLETPGLF